MCEDKNVPYVFVKSKTALGRACGVSRCLFLVSPLKRNMIDLKYFGNYAFCN